jgi:hypothetical protein
MIQRLRYGTPTCQPHWRSNFRLSRPRGGRSFLVVLRPQRHILWVILSVQGSLQVCLCHRSNLEALLTSAVAYDDVMRRMIMAAIVFAILPLLLASRMPDWYLADKQTAVEADEQYERTHHRGRSTSLNRSSLHVTSP